jgi:hypothetical protein
MLNAVQAFVASHPGICSADPPLILQADVSLEECQTHGFLHFMPGWIKDHPERVYLGSPCIVHTPEPLVIHALPQNAER